MRVQVTGSTSRNPIPLMGYVVCVIQTMKEGCVAMSNFQDIDDDFDFDFEEEDQPARKSEGNDLVRQLRKQLKAEQKRLKELEAETSGLRSAQRQSVIKNVLAERGVNEKVAAFIPTDIEPTADALTQWLDQHGDVFGIAQSEPQQVNPNLAALRQIDAVTANAQTPAGAEDLLLRLNQAASADEIINMIYSAE
jgi:hypothetical protein